MRQLTLEQNAEDLLALWREARCGSPLPPASFADPVKLRGWVGNLSIVQLEQNPKRFFVSLHGANVARHLGPDFHRKYLDDAIDPTHHADAFAPYELSIKTNQPTYSIQSASLHNGLFKSLERMVLPLCKHDPAKTDRFLIWVAPVESGNVRSTSVYEPFGEQDLDGCLHTEAKLSSELFLLSDEYLSSHAA